MAGTSPAMTREKWFNVTGMRSKAGGVCSASRNHPAGRNGLC